MESATQNEKQGRADLHMHTTHSDGMMNVPTLINYIATLNIDHTRKYGRNYLDVIAVTDHDTIGGSVEAMEFVKENSYSFDVLVGSEISSSDGHIIAINISEDIPAGKSAAYTIAAIHEQNGSAIAAHPYSSLRLLGVKCVGGIIKSAEFDAVEVVNSNITEMFGNGYTSHANKASQRLSEIGSSDAHFLSAFEKVYTTFPGEKKQDLLDAIRNKTTHAHGKIWGIIDLLGYIKDRRALNIFCAQHGIRPHNL